MFQSIEFYLVKNKGTSLMVKTLHFHCRGHRFRPCLGN